MSLQEHMQVNIGAVIPNPVIDGRWHSGRGKLGKISYVGHHLPKGMLVRYRDHREADTFHTWKEWDGRDEYINSDEYQQRKTEANCKAKRVAEQVEYDRLALLDTLNVIWSESQKAESEHPYASCKLIVPMGAKQAVKPYQIKPEADGLKAQYITPADLLIPIFDYSGALQGIQQITSNGKLVRGTLKGGLMWLGGGLTTGEVPNRIYIVEGWATGIAVHTRTRNPTVVAFTTANLLSVGEWVRARYPEAEVVYAVDNDLGSFITVEGQRVENPGKYYATKAARVIGAAIIMPPGSSRSDWCDWHVSQIVGKKKPGTRAA